ncbi:MAG: hypothetical protein K2X38_00235 [Gemmataceae bacterium]|nr:hypothetical protein [Gemmataceae bacterium]
MKNEAQAELQRRISEIKRCRENLAYFASTYCKILASNDKAGSWIPFNVWPAQAEVAASLEVDSEIIMLKARQLGFTWLVIALALRELLLNPVATVLLFSERDDEASELLSFRLKGMYDRLPDWMREERLVTETGHEIEFPNGSRALAFSTRGGRSYTATLCIVDEADHVGDLQKLLNAVKPTIDAGGRIILLSTVDKSQPESTFKRIYRGARAAENSFRPIFYGWKAAPWRSAEWYEEKRKTILTATGSEDDLHQEYPATEEEALSPRSLDKRIPGEWLRQCYIAMPPPAIRGQTPSVPNLVLWAPPKVGSRYVVGMDPAEGNPTSDDSAATFLDMATGEEVACLVGKLEPGVFAKYVANVAGYFHNAAIMCERNNHGHACLLWLSNFAPHLRVLHGHDGKPGWLSSSLGKAQLYDAAADAFKNSEVTLHSFATFNQLASIDGSTLRAPEGQNDDRADSAALAIAGRLKNRKTGTGRPLLLVEGPAWAGTYGPTGLRLDGADAINDWIGRVGRN